MVKKPHLQPLIMEVAADRVALTGVEWNSGHTLPESVLAILEGSNTDPELAAVPADRPDGHDAVPQVLAITDMEIDRDVPSTTVPQTATVDSTAPVLVAVDASGVEPDAPVPPADLRRSARLRK